MANSVAPLPAEPDVRCRAGLVLVLAVLDLLGAEGVVGWLDGGWGVEAVLGEQTRPHADLDLAVDEQAVDRLVTRLRDDGCTVLRDELPVSIALRHDDGREVDLHPLALTLDGGGDQQQTRWQTTLALRPADHHRPPRRPPGVLQQP